MTHISVLCFLVHFAVQFLDFFLLDYLLVYFLISLKFKKKKFQTNYFVFVS